MPDFSRRSTIYELMDNFSMSQQDLDINLLELETINKYLGGYAVSLSGILNLNLPESKEIKVADIGCGGGDGMIIIQKYLRKKGIKARMIGVDANPKAIEYAKKRCKDHPDFDWICAPFQEIKNLEADVIHCSLFTHHFYEKDLDLLSGLMRSAKIGFVINDLHRHWLAYYSISILTKLFSDSHLVQNDARLSVAKGFSKGEILEIFSNPSTKKIELKWKWAFRWQLVGFN
jgi:2-polyprenyl-3-methyl-5-hydroxy-6-metoxy-1,4-benzoquinol methylase